MTAYTSSGSLNIPLGIIRMRIILVGEGGGLEDIGGTGASVGSATTFGSITAYGGGFGWEYFGPANTQTQARAGAGGTYSDLTNIASVVSATDGEDGDTTYTTVGSNNINYGGDDHTFNNITGIGPIVKGGGASFTQTTLPSNQWLYYNALSYSCGNCSNSGTSPVNGVAYGPNDTKYFLQQTGCINPWTPGTVLDQCWYNRYVNKGGGGAGAFVSVTLSGSQLTPYEGTTVNYYVNEDPAGQDNGYLEVLFYYTQVYIKTSTGWQLVKNIYVNQSEVGIGWTTAVVKEIY